MKFRFLVLALLLIQHSIACSGEATLSVPAVVGNEGGLVNATVKLVPGDGDVFIGISPRTTPDTQLSAEEAVAFAKAASGNENLECDMLIIFQNGDIGGHLEGPSAGAAMSVLAFSVLQNLTPRADTVITGSIDSLGRVGAVGGLHEKAKAAALGGADYFVTPPVSFYEMLVLRNMEENYGITVVETYNASDIMGFMFFNRTINQTDFRASEGELPEVEPYDASGVEGFSSVADDMLSLLNGTLLGMTPDGEESEEVKKFFESKLNISSFLMGEGYYFTAANSAFLDYIDVSTIKAILEDDLDLVQKRDGAYSCLDSIKRPEMTEGNFQWIIGSDLRKGWALDKLNSTDISEPLLTEEKYALYHELMYADAWCHVSKSLSDAAGSEGAPVDEGIWKGLADEMFKTAEGLRHSPDTAHRLEMAKAAYARGDYGAAIFDAIFVMEMDTADADMELMTEEELTDGVDALRGAQRTSLWGMVYQAQGDYLAQQGATATAYRILKLAEGLDTATAMMMVEMELREDEEEVGETNNELVTFFQLLIFIIFILLLTYVTLRKRAKGRSDGNNNKRSRGAARAKQKKG